VCKVHAGYVLAKALVPVALGCRTSGLEIETLMLSHVRTRPATLTRTVGGETTEPTSNCSAVKANVIRRSKGRPSSISTTWLVCTLRFSSPTKFKPTLPSAKWAPVKRPYLHEHPGTPVLVNRRHNCRKLKVLFPRRTQGGTWARGAATVDVGSSKRTSFRRKSPTLKVFGPSPDKLG
jgi:hypothetical protein